MLSDNTSFLGQVLAWVAAAIAAVGAWLWVHTMGRISALEASKLDFKTFDDHVKRSDKSRDELRESIIALYGKVDEVKDLLIEQKSKRR